MRKRDPRSWIKNLPLDGAEAERLGKSPECTQEVIYGWLREDGATLESVAERCLRDFADFGCTQTPAGLRNALSDWRPWFELQRTFHQADAETRAVEQLLREKFPDATPQKIAAAGQLIFTMRARNAADTETFIELEKLRLMRESAETKGRHDAAKIVIARQALEHEREKFKAAIRTKVEAGLAEIAEQVKGNTAAEAALEKLKVAISA